LLPHSSVAEKLSFILLIVDGDLNSSLLHSWKVLLLHTVKLELVPQSNIFLHYVQVGLKGCDLIFKRNIFTFQLTTLP
jgi:hypothetical protein